MFERFRSNRRDFLRSATLLSTAAAVPMSAIMSACSSDSSSGSPGDAMAERSAAWKLLAEPLKMSGVYTLQNPGMWAGKEGSHVPTVAADSMGVLVTSGHAQGAPTTTEGHYILCQFVEGTDGTIFDFVMYTRLDEDFVSNPLFVPDTYKGELRVYQYCTEHDIWLATFNKT
jgi:desulfoferrodoxin (superoxide reductase-like protein)